MRSVRAKQIACATLAKSDSFERTYAPRKLELPSKKDHRLLIGTTVGERFLVRSIAGLGGSSIVYVVSDIQSDSVYAMKVLHHHGMQNAKVVHGFMEEIYNWIMIAPHPNIVNAHLADKYPDSSFYIILDYVHHNSAGRTSLEQYLACDDHIDTDTAVRWGIDFCLAMEHLNRHGITAHGDVKPSNLLVGENGSLRVTDFGTAVSSHHHWLSEYELYKDNESFCHSLNLDSHAVGTLPYMAPEVRRGQCPNMQSDIYSFGLVFQQLIGSKASLAPSGCLDGNKGTNIGTVNCERSTNSPALQAIISRCLLEHSWERWESFDALRLALKEVSRDADCDFCCPVVTEETAYRWNNKGGSLNALGRYIESISCCDRALDLDPTLAAAWKNKANALHSLGRLEEAVLCYDNAIKLDPLDEAARRNRSLLVDATGKEPHSLQRVVRIKLYSALLKAHRFIVYLRRFVVGP